MTAPWEWVDGVDVDADQMNTHIEDRLQALESYTTAIPIFRALLTSGQTTSANGTQTLTLATPLVDTAIGWSSAHPTRYTVQTPGWYSVMGLVGLPANYPTNNSYGASFFVNGVQYPGYAGGTGAVHSVGATVSHLINLNQGDYVELALYTGAATGVNAGSGQASSALELYWVAPL